LQPLGNAQASHRELVDFESANSRVTDDESADGHGANRQRADRECAQDQCPYCLRTNGRCPGRVCPRLLRLKVAATSADRLVAGSELRSAVGWLTFIAHFD
jgi:hypothetical protein